MPNTVSHSKIEELRSRARLVFATLASLCVLGGMPVLWRQADGGAPVLRPSLAGHRLWLACRSAINTVVPRKRGVDREWGLRSRAPPPPCEPSVACHAFACRPGAGAGGSGYGRRPHSRSPRPAHEQAVLTERRLHITNGAPRAWAGERGHRRQPVDTTPTCGADAQRRQEGRDQARP